MKDTFLMVLKFVVALLLVPVVIASTIAFQREVMEFDGAVQHSLWIGLAAYLVMNFFIYDFSAVYRFGQGVVTFCFQFLKPVMNIAPFVIPIYTVIVLIVFAIINALGLGQGWQGAFFVLIAFTFAMHLILTARDLYAKDSAPGKPTYFFGMGIIYIFDIFFIALVMNMTLPGFAFTRFFQALGGATFDIYKMVFTQLF